VPKASARFYSRVIATHGSSLGRDADKLQAASRKLQGV
jgi:hypothetical protein